MGFTNPLQYVAHTSTRAIQEGFGASAKRLGSAAIRNPIATGAAIGGTYGAFSENTSILGGAALGAGAGFGWKNRAGFAGMYNTASTMGRKTSFGGLMTGFNQANKSANKARSFVGPINNVGGRFSML